MFFAILIGSFNSKQSFKQSDMPEVKRKAGMTEQQWEEDKKFKQQLIKKAEEIQKRGY